MSIFVKHVFAMESEEFSTKATFSPPEMPPASLQLELTLGWEG
jgi:hypothetical protein